MVQNFLTKFLDSLDGVKKFSVQGFCAVELCSKSNRNQCSSGTSKMLHYLASQVKGGGGCWPSIAALGSVTRAD